MKKAIFVLFVMLSISMLTACGQAKTAPGTTAPPVAETTVVSEQTAVQTAQAFLDKYYAAVCSDAKTEFSKFILNENLLSYTSAKTKAAAFSQPVEIGQIQYTVQMKEQRQAADGTAYWFLNMQAEVELADGEAFGEYHQFIILPGQTGPVIADWYTDPGGMTGHLEEVCRSVDEISNPFVWSTEQAAAWVKAAANYAAQK